MMWPPVNLPRVGDILTEQLKKTPSNLEFGNSSGTSLMFMDGDEEGTVFYVDSTGLYRYAFGGQCDRTGD